MPRRAAFLCGFATFAFLSAVTLHKEPWVIVLLAAVAAASFWLALESKR